MITWRLCSPRYAETAMSGTGSAMTNGRWHQKGIHMVYTGSTISLAMLEILVQSSDVVSPVAVIRVKVPDDLIKVAEIADLPKGWDIDRRHAQPFGEAWFNARESVGLLVPSVVIPYEKNLLLNPEHPDFKQIKYELVMELNVDSRLLAAVVPGP